MPTRRAVLLGLCGLPLVAVGAGSAGAAGASGPVMPAGPIRFEVLRADTVIGRHDVTFERSGSRSGGGFAVRNEIDIDVKLLGVSVFSYRMRSTETWAKGRLQSFVSDTKDDDSQFFVRAEATPSGLTVTNRKETFTAPRDLMVASYWTPLVARQMPLLDPQRGRIKDQTLLGTDQVTLQVMGAQVDATRYRLSGVVEGWVAYNAAGDWVAAELKKRASDIVYRRVA